jgi:hypothetical protein
MRNVFALLVLCSLCGSAIAQDTKITHRFVIHPSSSVTINGKTNVNKYNCQTPDYKAADTLLIHAEVGKGARFIKGLARLDAKGFECNMDVITKDFADIIEADKYPYIKIDFISFEREPKFQETEEKFKGDLTITLGNAAVRRQVRCSIVKDENDRIHLQGRHNFTFSDFKLKAPTKMMGLVKVEEKITVTFHLVLTRF